MNETREEIGGKIGGQEFYYKGQNLQTAGVVAVVILCALILYAIFTHLGDTKDDRRELVNAMREVTSATRAQAIATREQTCLYSFPEQERPRQTDFCKRVTQ